MPPDDPTQTPDQRFAELERRENVLRTDRVRFELGQALSAAKCRPDALADALAVISQAVGADFDADGRLAKLTLAGSDYATPADAASAFLAARAYLVEREAEAPAPSTTAPRAEQTVADAWARPQGKPPAARPKTPEARTPANATLTELIERGYTPGDLASEGWATPPK
jgi:hypothetical protein